MCMHSWPIYNGILQNEHGMYAEPECLLRNCIYKYVTSTQKLTGSLLYHESINALIIHDCNHWGV